MQHLAAKGWVCVAINYRLAPRDPFPAHVDRREAGDRLDPRAHRGVRRQPRLHRHHRRLGGRPPDRAGRADRRTTRRTSPASRTPTPRVQAAVPHYGVYDFAGSTGLRSAELLRDGFLAPRILQKTWADSPDDFEAASPILRITEDAPDFFVLHGTHDTLVAGRPGAAVRGAAARGSRSAPSCTPSSPAPSTRSTSSRRSAPPTSSARSTATCTGTGTAGATRDRDPAAGRVEGGLSWHACALSGPACSP